MSIYKSLNGLIDIEADNATLYSLKPTTIVVTDPFKKLVTLSSEAEGNILANIGGKPVWVPPSDSGVSIVTAVGLQTSSPIFTITNSPIVGAGTISINPTVTPTGTGPIVLQSSPVLITPTIGVATGQDLTLTNLAVGSAVQTDGAKKLVTIPNSGTGSNILQTSPTLVTPTLGIASGTDLTLITLTVNSSVQTDGTKKLVTIPNSGTGQNILQISPTLVSPTLGIATGTDLTLSALTINSAVQTDGTKKLVTIPNSGTGQNILQTSPTLVSPTLGIATGTDLTLSALTVNSSVQTDGAKKLVSIPNSGTGQNILQTSPTLVSPTLGIASGTDLTLSALSINSSVQTDGTKKLVSIANSGTGLNILQTSPTLITPSIGAATGTSLILSSPFLQTSFLNVDTQSGNCTIDTKAGGLIFGYNAPKPGTTAGLLQIYNNSTDRELLVIVNSKGTSSGANSMEVNTTLKLTSLTASRLVYSDASKNLVSITTGADGDFLKLVGGVPTWSTTSASGTFTTLSVTNGNDNAYFGPVAAPTTPVNIAVRNNTNQICQICVAGGADQFSSSALQGDAVIRSDPSKKLILQNGFSGAGLVINGNNTTVLGNLAVNGTLPLNWGAWVSNSSAASPSNNVRFAVTGFNTRLGSAVGYQLSNTGGADFQNQSSVQRYVLFTFSGSVNASDVQFDLVSNDADYNNETVWARCSTTASKYASMSAIVGLPAGHRVLVKGAATIGGVSFINCVISYTVY